MKKTIKKKIKKAPKTQSKASNRLDWPMTTKMKMQGNTFSWPQ